MFPGLWVYQNPIHVSSWRMEHLKKIISKDKDFEVAQTRKRGMWLGQEIVKAGIPPLHKPFSCHFQTVSWLWKRYEQFEHNSICAYRMGTLKTAYSIFRPILSGRLDSLDTLVGLMGLFRRSDGHFSTELRKLPIQPTKSTHPIYSETLNNEYIERIHQMSYSSLSDNGMLQI